MLKRTWFPGLCALFIVGAVYWFFLRGGTAPVVPSMASGVPVAELLGGAAASAAGSNIEGPQMPNQVQAGPDGSQNVTQPDNNQKIMGAIMHTNMGDITIAFNPATPNTVANFVKLAKAGFYNGTKFHRVIKGFMNQGGDPLSKDDSKQAQWGTGGPGYKFDDEIGAENRNAPGTLAMANSGPNTNGSQFFINVADNSFLDTKHTVFGIVTAGPEVVMAINGVETTGSPTDRPLEPVVIESITLQ